MTHSARDHARLSASAAERWVNCSGSVALINAYPKGRSSSSYARRGTALHEASDNIMRLGVTPRKTTIEGHEYTVTDEDMAGLKVYHDYIDTIIGDADWYATEFPLDMTSIDKDLGGTADFCAVRDGCLWVVDLKTGTGVTVFPEDNFQLLQYGLGVYLTINKKMRQAIETVKLVIVQPWAAFGERIKVWDILPSRLIEHAIKLQIAAEKTRLDASLVPGPWCRWCPMMQSCPALRTEFSDLPAIRDEAIVSPRVLTPEDMGSILQKYEILKPWLAEIYARALALSESGVSVPGMKLVPKRAMRKWIDDDPQTMAAFIEDVLPKAIARHENLFKEPELKSPAQLEADIGKKEFAKYLTSMVEKKSSGNNLVPDTDAVKGPDLTPTLPNPLSGLV